MEDDLCADVIIKVCVISIHVPRVEDDCNCSSVCPLFVDFNPRPPCGGRLIFHEKFRAAQEFQSTSPVWRTTENGRDNIIAMANFNPRPPCGGRPCLMTDTRMLSERISIHVPRVEDDTYPQNQSVDTSNFNPRPPCGGRHGTSSLTGRVSKFQSTSPVWRTTYYSREISAEEQEFQSTSPVWRTTPEKARGPRPVDISIHVPRVEDDYQKS